jgi:D-inositol-3-phosphate glycosyltransferase
MLSAVLGIRDRVNFRGTIKQAELPYFYSAADVCVVPSYYESFGLVALEALACGTPVVASDVGDLKNFIRQGKTGYVVATNDPVRLADGISRVISWPPRDMESALMIRSSVNRYSWGNITRDITSEIYRVYDSWLSPVA